MTQASQSVPNPAPENSTMPTKDHVSGWAARWWDDGRILALLAAAGVSLKSIFIKLAYAYSHVDAITLLTLRMGLALPLFMWLARQSKGADLGVNAWVGVLALGFVGYYLSSLCDFLGLELISASLERIVLFTYPTIVLLIDSVWYRRWPTWSMRFGVALSYAGLLAAFSHDAGNTTATQAVWIGSGWVALCSISFAIYYFASGHFIRRLGATRLTGYSGLCASCFVLLHYGLTRPLDRLLHLAPAVWALGLALATLSTVLPIWLTARAVERIGVSKTSALATFGPVLTVALGWLVLGEPFSWMQVLGWVLVLAGISLVGKSK